MAASSLPFRSALVVVNPIAGRGRGEPAGEDIHRRLVQAGVDATLMKTTRRGDARERLEAMTPGEIDLVIAVGGDGTIGEVLEGLSRGAHETPVGVLPMGTGNVLSIDLGLPRTSEGLFEMLRQAEPVEIDLAQVGDRICFMVAGIGVDGYCAREVERLRKGPITMRTWIRAGLSTFFRKQPAASLRVTLDGKEIPGTFAFALASNVICYGRYFFLSPDRKLDDGEMEIYLFRRGERRFLLGYLLRGLRRKLDQSPHCVMHRAASMRVESVEPIPYQVDGDFAGETPFTLDVLPQRARLLVPKDSSL
ncbi:MAG: diacylglycerol kinase family protein [Planctomycetota bacterium]